MTDPVTRLNATLQGGTTSGLLRLCPPPSDDDGRRIQPTGSAAGLPCGCGTPFADSGIMLGVC